MHLSDAVIAFAKAQPRLRVSLILENTPYRGSYDFAERDLDLVLCFSTVRGTSVVEQEIATLDWVVLRVARLSGARRTAAEPVRSRPIMPACVHVDVAPNDSVWRFEGPKGPASVKVRGAFFSNAALTLRKAAVAGLGVTLVPRYAVADELAAGTSCPCATALSCRAASAARGLSADAGDPAQGAGLRRIPEGLDGGAGVLEAAIASQRADRRRPETPHEP